jgi:hypothetical protein
MTRRLDSLEPGARFALVLDPQNIITGRLEELGPGSATVTLDRGATRRFTAQARDGSERVVTLARTTERTTWSLGTLVEVMP